MFHYKQSWLDLSGEQRRYLSEQLSFKKINYRLCWYMWKVGRDRRWCVCVYIHAYLTDKERSPRLTIHTCVHAELMLSHM